MAAGYPTSDRLCRVITKNFLAEHELQQKLNSIERKKQKASVQISLNRLEIKKELQSIVSPENRRKVPNYPSVSPVRQRQIFALSGSNIPGERKRRNIRSYNELLRKLELKSTTNYTSSIVSTSKPTVQNLKSRQPLSLSGSTVANLPRPVQCRSPMLPQPTTKPVFTGVRARYSSLSKYTEGHKSTEAVGSVSVELQEPRQRCEMEKGETTARVGRLRPVHGLRSRQINRHSFPSLRAKSLYR